MVGISVLAGIIALVFAIVFYVKFFQMAADINPNVAAHGGVDEEK